MKVKATAHILEQGVRCAPGDILELRDPLAIEFLKRGLALPYRQPKAPVEFAVAEGAPEQALSARGRARRRTNTEHE